MAKRRRVVSREPKFSLRTNNQIRVPRVRLVGAAEALPKMEGRRMIVMISPKKAKKKN